MSSDFIEDLTTIGGTNVQDDSDMIDLSEVGLESGLIEQSIHPPTHNLISWEIENQDTSKPYRMMFKGVLTYDKHNKAH